MMLLQTRRKHAGKGKWSKAGAAAAAGGKGLSEVEEMEREEMSMKMMQSLERFMRKYPAVWSESSVQHLLTEIGDSPYTSSENGETHARLHMVVMRMLVPTVKLMEEEHESVKVEKQKIQEATLALKKDHDTSARALEELANALEESRKAAGEAERKLAAKETQIHLLLHQQQALVVRLVRGGPAEFLNWAAEEIQSPGFLDDLREELHHAWWPLIAVRNNRLLNSEALKCSSAEENAVSLMEPAYVKSLFDHDPLGARDDESEASSWCDQFACSKSGEKPAATMSVAMAVLRVVVSETLQQMGESCGRVRGPVSLVSAVAGFWIGLAGRMACLAMVTMFPQLMQKRNGAFAGHG